MIKRIIFFIREPLTFWAYEKYGIELLQQNGFKVEVWDVTPVVYPEVYSRYTPPDAFNFDNLVIFEKKKEFGKQLLELQECDFIINTVDYNYEALWLYKLLGKSKVDYAVFQANAIPKVDIDSVESKTSVYLRKFKKIFPPSPEKLLKLIVPRIPFKYLGVKSAKVILAGGEESLDDRFFPVDEKSEILWAHSLDYDLYLKEKETPSVDNKTAVFLDNFFPFHYDFIYSGRKPPVSAETYYPLLNKLFNLVEKKLEVNVVIASHPSSNYEEHPDYFEGRKNIRGQTTKLVNESRLVLCHYSTALSYVNLFQKPVVFMTTNDLENSIYGPYLNETAKWFGKKAINIDNGNENIDWDSELAINKDAYKNYRNAFIKTDSSENLPFWQIVANRLKKGL